MSDWSAARRYSREDPCPVCGSEGPTIMHNYDKFCPDCGDIIGEKEISPSPAVFEGPWASWHRRRRANDDYTGWHGEERIKMVGGFVGAYDFEEDGLLAD